MGKDSKARRERETEQESAKRQPQEPQAQRREKILAPAFYVVPNPFEGLNADQRRLAVQEITKNAEQEYQESLSALRRILRRYNPLLVLSFMSYYGLSTDVDRVTGVTKLESDLDILPSHIEILQALYLQIKANDLSYEPFRLEILEKIHNYVKQLSRAYSLRQLDSDSINLSDDKKAVKFIQRLMRDTTRVVRNWGHFSQVKRIVRELYSQFDAKLLEIRGFSVSDVINVFDIILSTAESRITTHRNTLADLFRTSGTDRQLLVKNYHSLIGSDKKETDRWIQQFNVKNFSLDDIYFIIISNYIYLRSSDVFTFSSFNLAQSLDLTEDQVIAILDEYALGWEALSEYDIEDFHLSNPVWMKPIIKLDDRKYFCALPVGFFSFAVPCIESLLSSFKDAVSERRAEYLEAKVTEIVKTRFPDSKIKRNFK
ncbi:MAG: hypothetical protein OXC96_06950 [Cyanobacteria bacterium MAG CAR1_bin_15]|nr:hypothetical protein [Cyanobacteria bacterium MAG CAR1_bin_15]